MVRSDRHILPNEMQTNKNNKPAIKTDNCLSYHIYYIYDDFYFILCLVLNTTFSNISAISWRPVLVVEEAGVPRENHRP